MEKDIAACSRSTYCNAAMAILAGVLVCYCLLFKNSKTPLTWPVVGMLPSLILHFNNFHEWTSALVIIHGGTFKFKAPGISKVIVAHPTNLEYVLKSQAQNFPKGRYFRHVYSDIFGEDFLFLCDAEHRKQLRSIVSAILFSAAFRTNTIGTTIMLVHKKLLPLLENASNKAVPIDLHDVFHRFAMDSICIAALGIDPGSLAVDFPHIPFVEAFEKALEISTFRFLKPTIWWRLLKYLDVGNERKLPECIKIMEEYLTEAVSLKRKELQTIDPDSFPILFQLEKESGRVYCDREIREISATIIMAGKGTTSVALAWFFWLVDQHPQVEANILLEIRRILNQRSRTDTDEAEHHNPSPFTLEEIKEMHYLHAALSESLRLYPPSPFTLSEVVEDDVLPDGTKVEKGSNVMLFFYSTARMETIWGSDCRQFKPERWLSDQHKFTNVSEFKFPVFSAGHRRCLGKELAYWQMKWVAASVMVRYRVRMVSGHPVVPKFGMNIAMKHGLLATFHPRYIPQT